MKWFTTSWTYSILYPPDPLNFFSPFGNPYVLQRIADSRICRGILLLFSHLGSKEKLPCVIIAVVVPSSLQ